MPRAFDGTVVPRTLERMPCGGMPVFDEDSGYAYRCDLCYAVIGSMGQPDSCKETNLLVGYEANANRLKESAEQTVRRVMGWDDIR